MTRLEFIKKLAEMDKRGVYVFQKQDIEKLFPEEEGKTLEKSLQRMVRDGLIERVAKGLYLNLEAKSKNHWVGEEIAKALRPGCLSYVSLESMLSEYGVISQIPINRLTVMTEGRSGVIRTIYGVIEFTHTKRSRAEILDGTIAGGDRPMRIASKKTAVRDLLRVGRNVNMMIEEELEDCKDE